MLDRLSRSACSGSYSKSTRTRFRRYVTRFECCDLALYFLAGWHFRRSARGTWVVGRDLIRFSRANLRMGTFVVANRAACPSVRPNFFQVRFHGGVAEVDSSEL